VTEKNYVEVEGTDLAEAVRLACESLGCMRAEMEYRFDRDHFRSGADTVKLQARRKDPAIVRALRFGREFVGGLLDRMDIDGSVDVHLDEDQLAVRVRSERDGSLLIGREGRTLEALQLVVGKAAARLDPALRVLVDVEDYRGRREEALREMALDAIAEVRRLRRAVTLRPMNAYERRIVHLEVTNSPGVASKSVEAGPGGVKRLQIFPE